MTGKSGKLLAISLLTIGFPAMAQKLPALPGSDELVAQPAFDCADMAPQPIGQDITMQSVTRSHGSRECPSHPMENICMLITLSSGQKILVTSSDTYLIDGKPLEAIQAKQLQQIGLTTLMRCRQARASPAFPNGTLPGIPMLTKESQRQKLAQTTQVTPAPAPANTSTKEVQVWSPGLFKCNNPAPQKIDDHTNMQIVVRNIPPYDKPPHAPGYDVENVLCDLVIPCVLFSLSPERRGLIIFSSEPVILGGSPIERPQSDRLKTIGYGIILQCSRKLQK